jgi:hypothetical protein
LSKDLRIFARFANPCQIKDLHSSTPHARASLFNIKDLMMPKVGKGWLVEVIGGFCLNRSRQFYFI